MHENYIVPKISRTEVSCSAPTVHVHVYSHTFTALHIKISSEVKVFQPLDTRYAPQIQKFPRGRNAPDNSTLILKYSHGENFANVHRPK